VDGTSPQNPQLAGHAAPIPSGDPPDGMEKRFAPIDTPFKTVLPYAPVGGSPTGAGESPAPPIFQPRS